MIVSDIMTRDVACVTPDSRLDEAVHLMVERKLSGLPVVEKDGRVAGVLTEGDLLRRSEIGTQGKERGWFEQFFLPGNSALNYTRTHGRKVGMLMTSDVVSVAPGAGLAEAAELMWKHRVKRLPVVENGRLIGILARADLLKVLAGAMGSNRPLSDPELRKRILAELERQGWISKASVRVDVDGGVAALSGLVTDIRQRDALCALAEAAGAKDVRDRIVCVEPISATVID